MTKHAPPIDHDENPEWTPEMLAAARPAGEVHGKAAVALVRRRGRPPIDPAARKVPVTIRLSRDVVEALRASGDGWQTRVDELLRVQLVSAKPAQEHRPSKYSLFGIMTRDPKTGMIAKASPNRKGKKLA